MKLNKVLLAIQIPVNIESLYIAAHIGKSDISKNLILFWDNERKSTLKTTFLLTHL